MRGWLRPARISASARRRSSAWRVERQLEHLLVAAALDQEDHGRRSLPEAPADPEAVRQEIAGPAGPGLDRCARPEGSAPSRRDSSTFSRNSETEANRLVTSG